MCGDLGFHKRLQFQVLRGTHVSQRLELIGEGHMQLVCWYNKCDIK